MGNLKLLQVISEGYDSDKVEEYFDKVADFFIANELSITEIKEKVFEILQAYVEFENNYALHNYTEMFSRKLSEQDIDDLISKADRALSSLSWQNEQISSYICYLKDSRSA